MRTTKELQIEANVNLEHLVNIQYIPRNMHTVFALLCLVVVIHWLIFPYPSGLLHWHCGNLTIAPVPAKQPWWIWKYFMWIHYERLHNHNKAKHNKTVCIFRGIYYITNGDNDFILHQMEGSKEGGAKLAGPVWIHVNTFTATLKTS